MTARVFFSYSHKDEDLRDQLEVQLAMLRRQGLIAAWHDRRMTPGDHLDDTIRQELEQADIILLLLSPDFLASDYCYEIEQSMALERHQRGEARVITVILRPCDWQNTELAQYLVTPTDGKPITTWPNIDEAFLDVSKSIRKAVGEVSTPRRNDTAPDMSAAAVTAEVSMPHLPRSSNLRLKKEFTESEKDRFLVDAFEYMGRFFEGSLSELEKRNPSIETRFRKIDANAFTATIYANGSKVAECGIRMGGVFGNGIYYSDGNNISSNSYHESLSVGCDDQKLFLSAIGMRGMRQGIDVKTLSEQGAAEYFWLLLIEPLQRG